MTNPWLLGAIGATVAWFLFAKESRAIVAGKPYLATFSVPPGFADFSKLLDPGPLPAGAAIEVLDGGKRIAVTFIAPKSSTMGDIPTPLGTFKLVSLKEMV